MSGKFQSVYFCDIILFTLKNFSFTPVVQEAQVKVFSMYYSVLSVYCRDFGYLHVYSWKIIILLSILKATPVLFHKYLPKTLFEMTDVAL